MPFSGFLDDFDGWGAISGTNLTITITLNAIFGGPNFFFLIFLHRAAAWTLGTYTYPPYMGVGLPIGSKVRRSGLLLLGQIYKKHSGPKVY